MSSEVHLDFETRSQCDLKKHGLHVYANHPTTEILVACYAFDDEPVKTWVPNTTSTCDRLLEHLRQGGKVIAHNSAFEREILNTVATKRYAWPKVTIDQFECTMSRAYAMAIPPSLERAAAALGIEKQKDMEGHRLMMRLSRSEGLIDWVEHQRLNEYCAQDVEVERELHKRLLALSPAERKVWELDQAINARGIEIDMASVGLALDVVAIEEKRLNEEMKWFTEGAVSACTAVGQIKDWLEQVWQIPCESLDKESVQNLLGLDDLPPEVRKVLVLRQEAGKSSVKKLSAMKNRVSDDNRIRGTLQYHGASTGRWSGRGIQPQNFPKGKYSEEEVLDLFELLRNPQPTEAISLFYGPPLQALSNILRSFIIAKKDHRLFWGDYNAIEARVLAWLANEQKVLDVFRKGEDIYVDAYRRSFNVEGEISQDQRQIGKTQVLALGYQGGAGAFQSMAGKFGVIISEEQAEATKVLWRKANPNIVSFWWTLEDAAMSAVRYSGKTFIQPSSRIAFRKVGSFLFSKLPSGRVLSYPYPRIEMQYYKNRRGENVEKEGLTYMGEAPVTGKWERLKAYGGMLAENATQAVARDLLVHSMLELEKEGIPVVFTVHDEVVTEIMEIHTAPLSEKTVEVIMSRLPSWAEGLPLAVKVKSGVRYSK